MSDDQTPKERFLVCHDYGMGGLWWWMQARSAREIAETFAEVRVIDDWARLAEAEDWELDEVDIDEPGDSALNSFRAKRLVQRSRPGFGMVADREVLHTRQRWEGEDGVPAADYLTEITRGYRTRQVEIRDSGEAIRTGLDDFPLNPPIDLWDPDLVDSQITAEEFESAWGRAVPAAPN
ncbi:hypothetical protein [Nocardia yamanashiensis]|uniref:hypothetical protein n=1 Tax=Nocardia yamanashiensis TaxID=209247 RepID=UPI00082E906F|nr:hypothetical protein [Nocardia yamanashiensis]